jgi:hypothetical protein
MNDPPEFGKKIGHGFEYPPQVDAKVFMDHIISEGTG